MENLTRIICFLDVYLTVSTTMKFGLHNESKLFLFKLHRDTTHQYVSLWHMARMSIAKGCLVSQIAGVVVNVTLFMQVK